jgi:hypothetical protein
MKTASQRLVIPLVLGLGLTLRALPTPLPGTIISAMARRP